MFKWLQNALRVWWLRGKRRQLEKEYGHIVEWLMEEREEGSSVLATDLRRKRRDLAWQILDLYEQISALNPRAAARYRLVDLSDPEEEYAQRKFAERLEREFDGTCMFVRAPAGPCKELADSSGFCAYHRKKKCAYCGRQATHECNVIEAFVCGKPLCDECVCVHSSGSPPRG